MDGCCKALRICEGGRSIPYCRETAENLEHEEFSVGFAAEFEPAHSSPKATTYVPT